MFGKVEDTSKSEKAIIRTSSSSGFVATEISSSAPEQSNGYRRKPMKWRRKLSHPTTTEDERWISRLRGFCDRIYPWTKSVTEAPYTQSSYPLTGCWAWNWIPSQLQADNPDVVAGTLSQQSSNIFQRIPFDEFVCEASGRSSDMIESFRWQYHALSWRLYRWCVGRQDNKKRLTEVRQSIQKIPADPFILDTIEITSHGAEKERYSSPKLEQLSGLIIQPLQTVLGHSKSANGVQLRILEIRFRRQYHSLDTNWDLPLETKDNELLQKVAQTEIPAMAESLSRDDHVLYRQLELNALSRTYLKPNQVRHDLNSRWNRLCRLVEECIAAGAGIDMKIGHLAQVVWYLTPLN
ncbi:hypothetical protein NUU61_001596 [Penicillium alfredii]|uniref:Uncharacterized protein n=1 Tax=Penicillium alfredii TaxID=1506179 RepID=A0A9W9KKQ7_9EURO|nr:uncharacterized protein NUU61_001596 [Penicillium alfredii]KAJ5110339.1 hypothetical protein NUU61_001596 [Penicillium alfredii]